MKDPAFLFYPGDWMGGTQWMTFEQKGCYMELLILQFNTGKFTESQAKQVLSICFDVACILLKQKFVFDGEFYFNERLKTEIDKRKIYTESRRINGLTPKNSNKHMHKHMEDENRNEVYSILLNKVLSENSILLPDGFELLILEWLKYKSEKGQSYKPTGLKTFINGFLKNSNGDIKTGREMIDYSMSNNWAGLFKDNSKQITHEIKTQNSNILPFDAKPENMTPEQAEHFKRLTIH